jgi:apolipoprotein N-acyltransferase
MTAAVDEIAPARSPLGSWRVPLSFRVSSGLAVLSGFLYFLAFPGVDLWPLGFVALVPLIVALRGQTPKRALWLGWLAGFTMTMTGFYWLLEMLRVFSGFPTALCAVFMAILCAYQGGRIALCGWLYARASARGWPAGAVFALAFAASEKLWPLLFPWYYAATIHQLPALMQPAELGGPILVGLTLVAFNLAVSEPLLARLEGRAPRWRVAAALIAVPLLSLAYGAVRIAQVDSRIAQAPKIRVGLVQANMSLVGKRRNRNEGLRRHLKLTRELQEKAPLDLVVWSETSVMSAAYEDEAEELYRRAFASRLGVPAIFGAVLKREVDDVRRQVYFNSALATDEQGNLKGRYDKQYLLAFGEYLPFGDVLPFLYEWSPNSGRVTPGTSLEPLDIAGHQAAVFICYEDIIPSFVNSIVNSGNPELLVNMTNDAWFGDTTEPWIHHALSKFRAIEQRLYFVRSTNSGVSAVMDPAGRVLAHTGTFEEAALDANVSWLSSWTPYKLWGDGPWWLVSAAAVALCFIRRKSVAAPRPPSTQPVGAPPSEQPPDAA